MELFLWLWLYDKRWCLNLKPSLKCYISLWLLPILTNIYIFIFGIYTFAFFNFKNCVSSPMNSMLTTPKVSIAIKTVLSGLIILTSILFIKDIVKNDKEDKAEKEFTIDNEMTDVCLLCTKNDYFVRRKSLYNINGLFLLAVSIAMILYSIDFVMNYNSRMCDVNVSGVLLHNSFFEILCALPLLVVLAMAATVKVIAFIACYTCPTMVIKISSLFSDNAKIKKTLDFKKFYKENNAIC